MAVKIGQALVASGILTPVQLNAALQTQLIRGGHLGTSLVEMGFVDEPTLGRKLAEILGMRYAPAEAFEDIPRAALDAVPREDVIRRQIVPLKLEGKCLHLAMIDRKNLSNLSNITGCKIVQYVAPEVCILQALERYYGVRRRLRFVHLLSSSKPAGASGGRGKEITSSGASPSQRDMPPRVVAPRKSPGAAPTPLEELALRLSKILTHADLGEVLLDSALRGCERRILFAVDDDVAELANSRNVTLAPETLNRLTLPIDQQSIFALATEYGYFRGALPADFDRQSFYGKLDLSVPREILVLAIHGEERLEAVLYGDGGTAGRIQHFEDSYLPLLGIIGLAVRMLDLRVQLSEGQVLA